MERRDIGEAPSCFTKEQTAVWDEFRRAVPQGTELCFVWMVETIAQLGAMDRTIGLKPGQLKLLRSHLRSFGLEWKDKAIWPLTRPLKVIQ